MQLPWQPEASGADFTHATVLLAMRIQGKPVDVLPALATARLLGVPLEYAGSAAEVALEVEEGTISGKTACARFVARLSGSESAGRSTFASAKVSRVRRSGKRSAGGGRGELHPAGRAERGSGREKAAEGRKGGGVVTSCAGCSRAACLRLCSPIAP